MVSYWEFFLKILSACHAMTWLSAPPEFASEDWAAFDHRGSASLALQPAGDCEPASVEFVNLHIIKVLLIVLSAQLRYNETVNLQALWESLSASRYPSLLCVLSSRWLHRRDWVWLMSMFNAESRRGSCVLFYSGDPCKFRSYLTQAGISHIHFLNFAEICADLSWGGRKQLCQLVTHINLLKLARLVTKTIIRFGYASSI